MGKKKSDPGGIGRKTESVSVMLARMDTRDAKPKKVHSSSTNKPKPKAVSSYIDGIDLPSFSDEEDDVEVHEKPRRQNKGGVPELLDLSTKVAKQEALKDDPDVFTVVIGSRASVLDGEHDADATVKDISINNFSVSARGKQLLKNASVDISHGNRYGLVGPNGKGKSTLLKLLAWRKIPVPKNIDVLLVEQEFIGDDRTALEAVVSANEELNRLKQEVAALQDGGNDVGEKLSELYEKLQLFDSDAANAQASKILHGLGFIKDMQARPTRSFSGGWRMRISISRAFFVQPTLLLLDEPTNHLDHEAVNFLKDYSCRWEKTLVVVSHYRDFLNIVCNEIIHLHDMKLHFYRGNYDLFESGYEQLRKETNKKFEICDKQIKTAKRSESRVLLEKIKNKGKSKVDEDEPPRNTPQKWKDYTVEFYFPKPTELTPPLLQLIEVTFSYPNREDFKLTNVDVGIDMGTRVAILGPNGAGKSTLLNLLAGDLVPTRGEVRRTLCRMDETPVQYLLRLYPDQEGPNKQEAVRAKLGKFGLPSHNHLVPITKLSGGQKSRVVFTSISMSKPHILLLDEPTNHLDMQSIDALADALDEFTGGVVLVSHDDRLISRVCENEEISEIWLVENGTVETFSGSYEDYKAEVDD
ncbi:hypothetical protein ACJIZ3_012947 [Penstemon smallii]|uniref:ABC transporter domain-containing protein n=1 Tax=Penstemon smallii TaxID=265156 RepID=A0ABD3US00_9LAMI